MTLVEIASVIGAGTGLLLLVLAVVVLRRVSATRTLVQQAVNAGTAVQIGSAHPVQPSSRVQSATAGTRSAAPTAVTDDGVWDEDEMDRHRRPDLPAAAGTGRTATVSTPGIKSAAVVHGVRTALAARRARIQQQEQTPQRVRTSRKRAGSQR